MALEGIKKKVQRLGFDLQEIPNDKYHKGVDIKYFEMRGKFINRNLAKSFKKFESAGHIITKDGYVIIGIDDFLGQVKSFKDKL